MTWHMVHLSMFIYLFYSFRLILTVDPEEARVSQRALICYARSRMSCWSGVCVCVCSVCVYKHTLTVGKIIIWSPADFVSFSHFSPHYAMERAHRVPPKPRPLEAPREPSSFEWLISGTKCSVPPGFWEICAFITPSCWLSQTIQ